MKHLQTGVLIAATLSAGLMAGLFAAFAYAVMPGLAKSSDHTLIEAMRSINKAILNPAFMLPFMGAIPLLGLAVVLTWRGHGRPAALADRRTGPVPGGLHGHQRRQRTSQRPTRARRRPRPCRATSTPARLLH
ncbi:DUF1772 domain-containing protein [Streptomyces sp. NPDC051644]|uniref:DUF1772 domain-containing protein n=1 Tax=Streptomyces sp. NPDC051644 TaxID=3365666 RepID=UPI00379988C6